jgi:hypothetical protein
VVRFLGPIILLALLTAPAFAQDTVTRTYVLNVYGQVDKPDDRVLLVEHTTLEGEQAGVGPLIMQLCGPDIEAQTRQDPFFRYARGDNYEPQCRGDGTQYTASVEVEQGSNLYFLFVTLLKSDPDNSAELIAGTDDGDNVRPGPGEDTVVIDGDVTDTAFYDFRSGQGGLGSDPGSPPLSATGAEADMRSALAAAFVLILAGGYIVVRRRATT